MKCRNCGLELNGELECPLCGHKNIGFKTCNVCSTKLLPYQRECPNCGNPQRVDKTSTTSSITPKQKTYNKKYYKPQIKTKKPGILAKVIGGIFIAYFVFFLIGFVVFMITDEKQGTFYGEQSQYEYDYNLTSNGQIYCEDDLIYVTQPEFNIYDANSGEYIDNYAYSGCTSLYRYNDQMYGLYQNQYINLDNHEVLLDGVTKVQQESDKIYYLNTNKQFCIYDIYDENSQVIIETPVQDFLKSTYSDIIAIDYGDQVTFITPYNEILASNLDIDLKYSYFDYDELFYLKDGNIYWYNLDEQPELVYDLDLDIEQFYINSMESAIYFINDGELYRYDPWEEETVDICSCKWLARSHYKLIAYDGSSYFIVDGTELIDLFE